jgi:hypothetical protein
MSYDLHGIASLKWTMAAKATPDATTGTASARALDSTGTENNGRAMIRDGVQEVVDCHRIATELSVPVTWVYERTRRRCEDPIPHVRLGKYVRFLLGSPELTAWFSRHIVVSSNR